MVQLMHSTTCKTMFHLKLSQMIFFSNVQLMAKNQYETAETSFQFLSCFKMLRKHYGWRLPLHRSSVQLKWYINTSTTTLNKQLFACSQSMDCGVCRSSFLGHLERLVPHCQKGTNRYCMVRLFGTHWYTFDSGNTKKCIPSCTKPNCSMAYHKN